MKSLVLVMIAFCAVDVLAMPTKAQLTKAQPLVAELMAPSVATYRSAVAKDKSAEAVKVGDISSEFAKSAKTEAAKFLLLKGAVGYYVRGEAYDKAADMIEALCQAVKDVPPDVIVEITGKATGGISKMKAPRLHSQYRTAKLQVRAISEVKTLAAKLKKVSSDGLRCRYAEALAISGNWKTAYVEFAKVSDTKLKAAVRAEAVGQAKNADAGEFWWNYTPTFTGAEDFFKAHAATFYRQALASGEITGLKKNIIEQRLMTMSAEAMSTGAKAVERSASTARVTTGAVSTGKAWVEKGNQAILTLPNGEQLEFVKCPPGMVDFRVGCQDWVKFGTPRAKKVKITRPFWIMTRPLAMRNFKGYPEAGFMFCDQKDESPYGYVEGRHTDYESFAENVFLDVQESLPVGYIVRLPSFAEWDYAVRANSRDPKDPYSDFDNDRNDAHGSLWGKEPNGKSPKNKWGIHELWREQLLDRISEEKAFVFDQKERDGRPYEFKVNALKDISDYAEDPLIWSEDINAVPAVRLERFWTCLHACREWSHVRLVVGPDLVSEWKAKHGKK